MIQSLFLGEHQEIKITEIQQAASDITLIGQSVVTEQACPACRVGSHTVHSYYHRCPQDLPIQGVQVRVQLRVKRFRCINPGCTRATFAERLPCFVGWHQQRTVRLDQLLETLAFELGGSAGARCLAALAIQVSDATLLRIMRKYTPPIPPLPTVIGVDDWAYRRGVTYGSLIVDLETHQPIAVLPDREAGTLAAWLRQHPQVEWVSRDRSKTYAEGIRQGAPQARQVADRWHLLKNLRTALNHTLTPFARQLRTIAFEEVPSSEAQATPVVAQNHHPRKAPRPLSAVEQLRQERRQYWENRFSEVHELLQQGWSISAIARHLNLDRKTVRKYQGFDALPPKSCTRLGPRIIDPYRAYLQKRLLSENPTGRQLLMEIQAQGYRGSKSTVITFVAQFRRTHGLPLRVRRAEIGGIALPVKGLTVPTLTTWVIMTEEQRTPAQSRCIRQACALHPRIARAIELTEHFAQALRSRQGDFLDTWIQQVSTCGLSPLALFAQGFASDYAAVQAAFISPYSNGQLEGQITRLKLLKRQMYGRAKFDLLRLRVLRP